jgi:hypothetical protein
MHTMTPSEQLSIVPKRLYWFMRKEVKEREVKKRYEYLRIIRKGGDELQQSGNAASMECDIPIWFAVAAGFGQSENRSAHDFQISVLRFSKVRQNLDN